LKNDLPANQAALVYQSPHITSMAATEGNTLLSHRRQNLLPQRISPGHTRKKSMPCPIAAFTYHQGDGSL
jgi:hypothetical protein